MARPFDRGHEDPLMLGACSGDPFWNDPSLLRYESLQLLFGLIVHIVFLVVAKATGALFSYLSR
jgi:hypothetical protein